MDDFDIILFRRLLENAVRLEVRRSSQQRIFSASAGFRTGT